MMIILLMSFDNRIVLLRGGIGWTETQKVNICMLLTRW